MEKRSEKLSHVQDPSVEVIDEPNHHLLAKFRNVTLDSSVPIQTLSSTVANDPETMTFEKKHQLFFNVSKMPSKNLQEVASIIARCENLADPTKNEVEVDFEALRPETLKEVEGYVSRCIRESLSGNLG